jgi:hypothetical protein
MTIRIRAMRRRDALVYRDNVVVNTTQTRACELTKASRRDIIRARVIGQMLRFEITDEVILGESGIMLRNAHRVFAYAPFVPGYVIAADADGNITAVINPSTDHFHPLVSEYPPAAQYLVLTKNNRLYWLKSEDGRWYTEVWEKLEAPQFSINYARVSSPIVERALDYFRRGY